jgi:peptidylprolyl isomerase
MFRTAFLAAAVMALAAPAVAQAPAPASAPAASDWRTPNPDDLMVIDTNKGRIIVELMPDIAPAHIQRIKELTRAGFYDGRSFFRVIDQFMAQTGDPEDQGTGGSDKPDLTQEFLFRMGADSGFVQAADENVSQTGFIKSLPVRSQSPMLMAMTADGKISAWPLYCPGVAAMARGSGEDSANSQFFLMRQSYPSLEKRYTGWGRVVSGLDVVRSIKVGEPVTPPQDKMDKVRILADIPAAERPKVRVVDTASPWFKAQISNAKTQAGANFSVCDINIPSEVK